MLMVTPKQVITTRPAEAASFGKIQSEQQFKEVCPKDR